MFIKWVMSLTLMFTEPFQLSGEWFPVDDKTLLVPRMRLSFDYMHSVPETLHSLLIDASDIDYLPECGPPLHDKVLTAYEQFLQEWQSRHSLDLFVTQEDLNPSEVEEFQASGVPAPVRHGQATVLWFTDFSHLWRRTPDDEQGTGAGEEGNDDSKRNETEAEPEAPAQDTPGPSSASCPSPEPLENKIDQIRRRGSRLGSGRYGVVYLVRIKHATGPVRAAAKTMKNKDQNGFKILDRERRWLKTLHHPGIVKLIGYESDGILNQVIYLEFLPYGYYQLIVSEDPLQEFKSLEKTLLTEDGFFHSFSCMLDVLEFLYEKGILYIDLHVDNIRFTGNGILKLIDFGLLFDINKELNINHAENSFYLAPEIRDGKKITVKGQMYSVGLLMMQMIHGKYFGNCSKAQEYIDLTRSIDQSVFMRMLIMGWEVDIINEYIYVLDEVAYPCCESDPDKRPDMDEVIEILRSTASDIADIMDPEFVPSGLLDSEEAEVADLIQEPEDVEYLESYTLPVKRQKLESDQIVPED
ncbi:hypothetical protein GZ77_15185 [Endozoicomonas montiporae]|uniref:Protein kinase domain-containing protein n=2 Tax=Endozoicomonas montiporae TaxID=1027273 RepID=A0A081N5C6_9GAMM|nr:protein kinase [Endozoicomonas montiporae]AMO57467.1 serine/threonine protein kinase [Endozoicomonas montiporae CL-33]KEQ13649.1 hypothetical protein GZ77_15185 [Endozoicomonas montiporae]